MTAPIQRLRVGIDSAVSTRNAVANMHEVQEQRERDADHFLHRASEAGPREARD